MREMCGKEWKMQGWRRNGENTDVTLFLKQVVRTGSIPFALLADRPNRATRAALREAERLADDSSAQTFSTVDDLFRDLDA